MSWMPILGGLVFGIGAVLNGGCAFSTLTRLGAGDLGMLFTLLGFTLGVATTGVGMGWTVTATAELPYLVRGGAWQLPITVLLLVWAIWELRRWWRRADSGTAWRQRLVADRYRLSTAAALMGIANAVIYGMYGTWPYTKAINDSVHHVVGAGAAVDPILWVLFGGLTLGVVVSAGLAGRFALAWRPRTAWLGNLAGGAMMGAGAAMIPGGNDVLLLNAIPLLSPHAVPAYLGVVVGVAATLGLMVAIGRPIQQVDCSGDICRA